MKVDSHAVHALTPVAVVYLPWRQAVQAIVPLEAELYVPTAHAVHAAHVAAEVMLPYAPARHAVHTVALAPPATVL